MSDTKEADLKKEDESLKEEQERSKKKQMKSHPALGAVLNFYLWLPTPLKIVVMILGLVYSPPMVQNMYYCLRSPSTGKLKAISGPDYIFFYLAGMWGLIFCWTSPLFSEGVQSVMTWIYFSLVLLTYITVGLDFKGAAWVGVLIILFGLFAVAGWIGSQNDVPVLELIWPMFDWFRIAAVEVDGEVVRQFPRNYVFPLSAASLFIFVLVWIRMNMYNVLKIEGNYVQVWTLAHKSPKDTRASFSLIPDYDDINEALMGFSCRLNLKSKSSRIASHEFPNMPAGPVVEHIATHLLNAQEVKFAEDDHFGEGGGDGEDDD